MKELLPWATVLVPVLGAVGLGLRNAKSTDRTGMASQYTAITTRLANVETRLDASEKTASHLRTKFNIALDFIARQGRFSEDLIDMLHEAGVDTGSLKPPKKPAELEED